ncbi:hypothetical protein [Rudaeicoccus suwonensis]|uniref:Uncharacterized protein n=1 Tax=Rudaeicoccus suwonensis TaxID=657409 RepID=A0A561EBV2_9MICO|nr:hypothetical protein [Rudaeicoccus suwonensis]TWE13082.1 hypothetical protein BKA23_1910 [Rudaeicoccus suwonensis]
MAFSNPAVEATEAARALRLLARETRTIESPTHVYQTLGALSEALYALGESLDQLADWHERNVEHAMNDDGDRTAGRQDATAAALLLRDAATLARRVKGPLREAFAHNGRIAWSPDHIEAAERNRARPLPPASMFGRNSAPMPQNGSLGR